MGWSALAWLAVETFSLDGANILAIESKGDGFRRFAPCFCMIFEIVGFEVATEVLDGLSQELVLPSPCRSLSYLLSQEDEMCWPKWG